MYIVPYIMIVIALHLDTCSEGQDIVKTLFGIDFDNRYFCIQMMFTFYLMGMSSGISF